MNEETPAGWTQAEWQRFCYAHETRRLQEEWHRAGCPQPTGG